MTVLDDDKKPVVVFEELVYFGDCEMVYDFQLVNLLFEELPFCASDFVLVDDVDSSGEGGFFVDGLSKFVELVLFQAGREHIVLFFDAALNFLDKVGLLEFDLVFLGLSHHVGCTFFVNSSLGVVAHYIFYSMESDRYIS